MGTRLGGMEGWERVAVPCLCRWVAVPSRQGDLPRVTLDACHRMRAEHRPATLTCPLGPQGGGGGGGGEEARHPVSDVVELSSVWPWGPSSPQTSPV